MVFGNADSNGQAKSFPSVGGFVADSGNLHTGARKSSMWLLSSSNATKPEIRSTRMAREDAGVDEETRGVRGAPRRPSSRHRPALTMRGGRAQRRRLDLAQMIFTARCEGGDIDAAVDLLRDARAQAERLVGRQHNLAETTFSGEALAGLVAGEHLKRGDIPAVAAELRDKVHVSLLAVGLHAIQDPRLLVLPLETLLVASLSMLEGLGALRAPSIWSWEQTAAPRLLQSASEVPASVVPELLLRMDGDHPVVSEGAWTAVSVYSFQRPRAVLAFRVDEEETDAALALATAFGRLLSRAFERASLYAANAQRSTTLVQSSERRLIRLGFDLHDGPLQDVAILAGEVANLRADAMARSDVVAIPPELMTRIDDIAAAADHLDDSLRAVANTLSSSEGVRRPFEEAIATIARVFGIRTGIEPDVRTDGDFDLLSDSQRTLLLRVVQESLANVAEHSKARTVRIAMSCKGIQVVAAVEDDGVGFDVDATLRESARRGRMGLLGVMERVRLLGGICDIRSAPGQGCCVSLTVARWTLAMAAAADGVPAHVDGSHAPLA